MNPAIFIKYIFSKLGLSFFPYRTYLDKKRCIFIHIPKTAGTSILAAIGKSSQDSRDHLPWYVYYTADPYKFNKYFKFTFVRNPWDRIYSTYRYLQAGGNQKCDTPISNIIKSYQTFDQFIIDGLGNGHFRNHLLFLPMANFILGPNEEIMVDFVGRYENLQKDFERLGRNLKLTTRLPKLNRSPHLVFGDYTRAYCSSKSIDIVGEIYKQDISVFNYNFRQNTD